MEITFSYHFPPPQAVDKTHTRKNVVMYCVGMKYSVLKNFNLGESLLTVRD